MRENPWHLRIPTAENSQWFSNLVDLHEITTSWVKELLSEKPSYVLTRGIDKEVSESLWMLDSFTQTDLGHFMDDTQPTDVLARLEHTIWAVQAWTVDNLEKNSPVTQKSSLESLLTQICWRKGKECAENRWKALIKKGITIPLQNILLALNHSPFSGYPYRSGFLIRRATQREIEIELTLCPHQIHYREVSPCADILCRLHSQWMRGFAYGLNSQVSMEYRTQTPRCIQRWFLASGA